MEGQDAWYPPNAYHTYWTLELLERLERKFPDDYKSLDAKLNIQLRRNQMQEWAKQRTGVQIALHSANSSVLDSDQLAWSLAISLKSPEEYQSKLSQQDFIRQALRYLFSTQTEVGTWRHYAPLFHYKRTGNAYCLVFETFAVLLKEALQTDAGFVRTALKDYFWELVKLWRYADATKTNLIDGGERDGLPEGSYELRKFGWSSGHRTNQLHPESWTTASVFDYAQSLRRLIGLWAKDEALASLRHSRPYPKSQTALKELDERTNVWHRSAGLTDRICSMFINPANLDKGNEDLDPDVHVLDKDHPRSAILFGPPGTSKTTIAKAIAGAVGWEYVELHASDFVAEGLPNVQHTADLIFRKLMQLDHAVVLFDEVDELVRERDAGSDAFGRFLTTSMLPKIAELWKARKILYFVATNHIKYFDRAITRSERFDAVLFVSPPAFDTKRKEVLRILRDFYLPKRELKFAVTAADIESALPREYCKKLGQKQSKDSKQDSEGPKVPLPKKHALAKFALLRWDELPELALRLYQHAGGTDSITTKILESALIAINDDSWRDMNAYCEFINGQSFERRDFSVRSVWVIDKPLPSDIKTCASVVDKNKILWFVASADDPAKVPIPRFLVHKTSPGHVQLMETPASGATAKPAQLQAKPRKRTGATRKR
jgi:hypothetical protein